MVESATFKRQYFSNADRFLHEKSSSKSPVFLMSLSCLHGECDSLGHYFLDLLCKSNQDRWKEKKVFDMPTGQKRLRKCEEERPLRISCLHSSSGLLESPAL